MNVQAKTGLVHLNEAQRNAVTHTSGPLLVIAGAGTGKTAVITERIAWLVKERGIRPDNILALTFTERAASEMEERVDRMLPLGYSRAWIETFHGFCERTLREYALEIGLDPSFTVITPSEQWMLLRRHLFDLPLDYFRPLSNPTKFLQALVASISAAKDQGIPPERFEQYAVECRRGSKTEADKERAAALAEDAVRWNEFSALYRAVSDIALREGVMDFADLITYTIRLLRTRPSVYKKVQDGIDEVLVDEFQDTNGAQNELIQLIAPPHKGNVTVVGDDDQSIYAWRGSNIANILQFQDIYSDARKIVLTENYRSHQQILDSAYTLIQHNNPYRLEKTAGVNKRLISHNEDWKKNTVAVRHFCCLTVQEENAFICSTIRRMVDQEMCTYRDVAVLTRTNAQADEMIPFFVQWDIPYHVAEARGLLARPEIRDVTAWLRLAVDPHNAVAAFRVLSLPVLDIASEKRQHLFSKAVQENKGIVEIFRNVCGKEKNTVSSLLDLLDEHMSVAPRILPSKAIYQFLDRTGYLKWCEKQKERHPEFFPNLGKFLTFASEYEQHESEPSMQRFVEYLDIVLASGDSPSQAELDTDVDAVRFMTVHGAKGLEFPIVFLPGATSDKYPIRQRSSLIEIPTFRTEENPLDIREVHEQEERRLFYVGMTRAAQRLYVTSAERSKTGKTRRRPSPFLGEAGITTERIDQINSNQQILPFAPPSASAQTVQPILLSKKFSVSQIEVYQKCPLQYQFRYIYCVPTPPAAPMMFGITIHNVLHAIAERVLQGDRVGISTVEYLYNKHWQSSGYQGKAHEQHQKESGLAELRLYLSDRPFLLTTPPIFAEQSFRFKVKDSLVTGRIDRVDRLEDGTVAVTDFKTGSVKTKKDADKNLQLSVYALALKEVFHIVADRLTLSFLKDNIDIHTTRSEHNLKATKKILDETFTEIRSGNFAPNSNPYTCGFCAFRTICDNSAV